MIRFLLLSVLSLLSNILCSQVRSVYPVEKPAPAIVNALDKILALSEEELIRMVPPQGGFRFCGSPESSTGAQENNMVWEPELGDKVQCQFTKTLFPNDTYPENGFIDFKTPTGKTQRFHYHEDKNGKRYWFEGRKWYEQRILLERSAVALARLYASDPENQLKAGKYAALILTCFAAKFPDYIISFDYPGLDKRFYNASTYPQAVEERKHDAWRLARWSWWAYMDVSESLILAYDILRDTPLLSREDGVRIENDLFAPMLTFVDRYKHIETTNMHPTLWSAQAVAANVLKRPDLIEEVNRGIGDMLKKQFTCEGFWKEASVSYHRQTASGLNNVFKKLYPGLTNDERQSKMAELHPALSLAIQAQTPMLLPDGRYASMNDSWASDRYQPVITRSEPHLMTGLKYAVLGVGTGDNQLQAHVNFNGHHGHDHLANLNLILFAKGKELLSDIGYTHTKARTWTGSTTAHNLVVVNGKSQTKGNGPYSGAGSLLLYNASDPAFQAIEADATNNYAEDGISLYRRMLLTVAIDSTESYVFDVFNVNGKGRKDFILHGSADESQRISINAPNGVNIPIEPALIPGNVSPSEPEGLFDFRRLRSPFWAHTLFKNVKSGRISDNASIHAQFHYSAPGLAGLRSWMLSQKNDTVHTADSWAVRNTREDQSKLDEFLRSSVILTRHDTLCRFVALHAPYDQNEAVKDVSEIHRDEITTVVQVTLANGSRDLLIYQSEPRSFSNHIGGRRLTFEGRIGFVRISKDSTVLRMIDGTRLTFGSNTINASRITKELKSIEGNTFKIDGELTVKPGETLIVDHSNGFSSSYRVQAVRLENSQTFITPREPAILSMDGESNLRQNVFPFHIYPGPHRVRTTAEVSGRFK